MEKQYQNYSAYFVTKSPPGSGSLRIFDFDERHKERGQMFLMVAIDASDKDNEKITRMMAEELGKQFFSAPTANIEFAFENALARVNIALKDTLLTKPKNWLNKVHIVCAVFREQEVHLTSVGQAHAYLVQGSQIVDVLDGDGGSGRSTAGRTPNPVKLFSNIVSGRLLPQAALVILNESVLDYLSEERIRKVSLEYPPQIAVTKLMELLSAAPANKQFGLAIVKRLPAQIIEDQAVPEIAPEKEKIIAQYLKPEPAERLPAASTDFKALTRYWLQTAASWLGQKASVYGQKGLTLLLLGLSRLLELAQKKLTQLLPRLLSLPKIVKAVILDQRGRDYYLTQWKNYFIGCYRTLPPKQKKTLIAIGVLCLLLIASIALRAGSRARTQARAELAARVAAITGKADQAEASLIYKDEGRARQILQEALAEAKTLSESKPELENRIHSLLDKIEKKKRLENLAAWTTVSLAGNPALSGLVLTGKTLVYYSGEDKRVIKIDPATGSLSPLSFDQATPPFLQAVALDDNSAALLGSGQASVVDLNNGSGKNLSFQALADRTTETFASYAKNIYTFSRAGSQIMRWREVGGTWQAAAPWLRENYDLSQMLDIAVDGSLYLLSSQNFIQIFANNAPSKQLPIPVADPIGRQARLYTNEELDKIYILDPEHERVIQLTKNGELLAQFVSPELKIASSLVVSKDEKQIYILASDKIYKIDI